MIDYLIIFLLGAVMMRLMQFILSITPNYYIFKQAEYTVFKILADLHVQKLTIMKIMQICYDDLDKLEDYKKVESTVNKRYDDIINKYISNLKSNLPYKTDYNNLNEAMYCFIKEQSDGRKSK